VSRVTVACIFRIEGEDERSRFLRNSGRYYVPGSFSTLEDFEIEKSGFLQRGKQVLNHPDDKFYGSKTKYVLFIALQGESRPHRRMN